MPKSAVGGKTCHSRKSLTTTVAEAEELVALATEKEGFGFQNRRWDSDLKTVRQVLLDGVLRHRRS
jgi:predicted dehydrogenase